MRRFAVLFVLMAITLVATPAFGQEGTIIIEVEGVARGNEGDVVQVAEEPVPAPLIGALCTGTVATENNSSVHPNNTLIIETGGLSAEIPNVEEDPGEVQVIDGTIVIGDTITVSMRFGPDGVTSGGFLITLICAQQTTTTTSTTTTTPPPTGGVPTGAGGTADGGSGVMPVAVLGAGIALLAGAGVLHVLRGRWQS